MFNELELTIPVFDITIETRKGRRGALTPGQASGPFILHEMNTEIN